MARVRDFEINGCNVITVMLDLEDTRVCDYCNEVLISWDGDERRPDGTIKEGKNALVVRRRCHSTDYGLMCDRCRGKIRAIKTYELDELVRADFLGNLEKTEP
jgi:hypothetical protein